MVTAQGKIYLVGAGPGSVAHLTVQAQQLLTQANALVYDALVDPALLQLLPGDCETIHVGKRGGQPSVSQAEINQQLVTLCHQGKIVVRLKSGDPFIFGRATAEIQALRAAGCAFEVVPGLSSVLAAPLMANIPLTDPVMSHGFGVFTAHQPDVLDWATIGQIETLVFLMGGRHLPEICYQLQTHGKRGETPVAIIRWAGQPQQQLWTGTLLSVPQITKGLPLSPCIIVVGEVVNLREFVQPVLGKPQPLRGKTVLVTRAEGQSSQFATLLAAQGATVVDLPALVIRPPTSWQGLDQAMADLSSFDWLVLTSANAVTFFLDRLITLGKDLRTLAGLKIAVVGKKTAKVLQDRGITADFIPSDYVADSLVDQFPDAVTGLRVLFPRVESGGREVLVKALTTQGATVIEVAAYESGCPRTIAPAAQSVLATGQVNVITFASSKTVRHFDQLMTQTWGTDWQAQLAQVAKEQGHGVAIASIGPQTSKTCDECLGRVDIEAQEYTLEGLTQAIVQWADASSA
jgi:uroporphyrinogen III methyltransferase/synthase